MNTFSDAMNWFIGGMGLAGMFCGFMAFTVGGGWGDGFVMFTVSAVSFWTALTCFKEVKQNNPELLK